MSWSKLTSSPSCLRASSSSGHPVTIEQKYMPGATDFTRSLGIIEDSDADGIVIWGDAAQAGLIVKQMRAAGMKQRVFGSFRIAGDALLENGGSAAEDVEAVYPFDPTRDDPLWVAFRERFAKRFQTRPEV